MTDFEYEERYGERILGDWEEEQEQRRIDNEERLENLERCVSAIKDLVGSDLDSKEELLGCIEEIRYEIEQVS